jgi:UDP-N-acetylmuramyl pentapeptide phosphotransferase/UDP-N-acetylglucosamine-1-phosphate transferase
LPLLAARAAPRRGVTPAWALSLVALLVAAFGLAVLSHWRARLPQAPPGPRSLHAVPTPRVGGLAIWAGFAPAALLAPPALPGPWPIWLAALAAVAIVSLIDDWRGVHPIPRLAVHLLAALAIGWWLVRSDALLWRGVELALVGFVLVWAANLYNFMDGSDGIAAAMGAFGFGAYGIAATIAHVPGASYFALAAAALAFFAINLPPARMFMGDVGSVGLGLFAAAAGLGGWRTGAWPAWFPLLVFLPFVADATVTLAKRVWRRERLWEAHRQHYYQRLHRLGAGHRGTLLAFGVLMTGTATSALATLVLDQEAGWVVTAAWTAALAAFFAGIDYHWRHRSPAHR